jgi:hypothetical protein
MNGLAQLAPMMRCFIVVILDEALMSTVIGTLSHAQAAESTAVRSLKANSSSLVLVNYVSVRVDFTPSTCY